MATMKPIYFSTNHPHLNRSRRGAVTMEYVILAAMIAATLVATVQFFGATVLDQFELASSAMVGQTDAAEGAPPDANDFAGADADAGDHWTLNQPPQNGPDSGGLIRVASAGGGFGFGALPLMSTLLFQGDTPSTDEAPNTDDTPNAGDNEARRETIETQLRMNEQVIELLDFSSSEGAEARQAELRQDNELLRAALSDMDRAAEIETQVRSNQEIIQLLNNSSSDDAPARQAELRQDNDRLGEELDALQRSQVVTVDGNTFEVHDMDRREYGYPNTRSVPGDRIISMDSNSFSGQTGEILRPLVVIPDDATPQERAAAQAAADGIAQWLNDNTTGGNRHTTGTVRTTSENGRGLNGFYHTEFHSVNDTDAVQLIRDRPQEYARIISETMGEIPGANFIVPHGTRRNGTFDPGAVGNDGTSEVELGRLVINEGLKPLGND